MRIRYWCLLLCFTSFAAFAAQLKTITMSQNRGQTSLYFSINGPFTHQLFTLSNPLRVVLDLKDTQLRVNVKQANIKNSLIQQVRSGQPDSRNLRLVFDVSQKVVVRSSSWSSNAGIQGIRIDFLPGNHDVALTKTLPVKTPGNTLAQAKSYSQVKSQEHNQPSVSSVPLITHQTPIKVAHSNRAREVVVVLDAGHGGKDPGARGPRHSKEKDIVLAITLKLKKLIDRQRGMRAVLTRSGDYYVGLRQRLDMARKYNGDVFVSIHADAFNNPHSNGASVFALSQRGATSEAARWLAEKENYSELGGVNLSDLDDQNAMVRSVLIDLSQTATISAGLQMGSRVLKQLNSFTNLHNSKVEQARFVVLKSPDIPSILVETGFISNPVEERNLTSYAYQARLSQAIFNGITSYFRDNPPS